MQTLRYNNLTVVKFPNVNGINPAFIWHGKAVLIIMNRTAHLTFFDALYQSDVHLFESQKLFL